MGILSNLYALFSNPVCIACGGPAKYDAGEQKNYIAMDLSNPEDNGLICKSCAKFFEDIDQLRKKNLEEIRRERLPRGTDRRPK